MRNFFTPENDPIFDLQHDVSFEDIHAACEGCAICDGEEGHTHDHNHEAVFDPATGLYTVTDIYVIGYGADAAVGSPDLVVPFNSGNKADFDYDAAAVQLTRDLRKFGDGIYNNGGNELGTSSSISWAFDATPDSGFSQVTTAQMLFIIRAFDYIDDVADVSFTRNGTGTSGPGAFSDTGDILFVNNTNDTGFTAGQASFSFYPAVNDQLAEHLNADIWITNNTDYVEDDDFGMSLILHEIGHALGLSHPSDYSGTISYGNSAEYFQDSLQYTVMSYFSETNTGANFLGQDATNLMLHDIAALQRLYGENTTIRTGDTVYGFNSNTGNASWDLVDTSDSIIAAVWDAGGIDTLDVSGFSFDADLDLREEAFSSFGGMTWNFSIARGTVIENAIGGTGDDSVLGNGAANALSGLAGIDTLNGAAGDDALTGGSGNDTLIGGAGTDTIFYSGNSTDYTIADIGGGQFSVTDNVGNEGVDTVTGDVEFISFADGTFVFEVPVPSGDIVLTINDDNYTANADDNVIYAQAGNDNIFAGDGNDSVYGEAGNDYLRGDGGDDYLDGGFGVDFLRGGAGADTLFGGAGQDWADYSTSSLGVTVDLAAGTGTGGDAQGDTYALIERVLGSSKEDSITGDAGVNYLRGLAGNDTLIGGAGNDYLQGDLGADHHDGGAGNNDWVYYASSTVGLTVNLGNTALNTGEAIGDTYANIENLVGSNHDDNLTGDSSNNFVRGLIGDDVLNGGDGNDFLRGDQGADVHDGGAGLDWAYYVTSNAAVTVNLGTNTASGGHAAGDSFISIERVFGSVHGDDITGDSGANYLRGFFGNDTLNGGAGNDFLQGDSGADFLNGGTGSDWAYYASSTATSGLVINLANSSLNSGEAAGDGYSSIENVVGSAFNDTITGDSFDNYLRGFGGDDIINGGGGDDILRGESGSDTFVFTDSTWGDDLITDFTNGQDLLDFSALGLGFNDFVVEQIGNNTLLTIIDGTNQSLTLQNFVSLDLDASDFA